MKVVCYFKLHMIGLNKLILFKLLWKKRLQRLLKIRVDDGSKGFPPFVENTLSGDCGLMELSSAKPPPV